MRKTLISSAVVLLIVVSVVLYGAQPSVDFVVGHGPDWAANVLIGLGMRRLPLGRVELAAAKTAKS